MSVDGSEEMTKIASEYIGQEVLCSTFQDYEPNRKFDGIWACASLLHLSKEDIVLVMRKLAGALNEDGSYYEIEGEWISAEGYVERAVV